MIGLTKRQAELLQFLRAHKREHGVMPTQNKIASVMGWKSRSGAHYALAALAARGQIIVNNFMIGGIKLLPPEYDHKADCLCERCPARRIQYEQFVQALEVTPPVSLTGKLVGLRPLRQAKPSKQSCAGTF